MGCTSCGTGANGVPSGCGSKGNCSTGGCNKRNTYDWLTVMDIYDPQTFEIAEVSFKKGSRKDFFKSPAQRNFQTGDMVLVEAAGGYDVGQVSLSGELVRLQLKKRRVAEEAVQFEVIRVANDRDLEKLHEARKKEQEMLVRARVISRTLGLEMKIGDVEYRGDKRKATFFYTAEGRVDFRELVRSFAKEFKIKIEMRQIGARQESARIGGLGSCGRELCCSTWLSNFKSVSTGAARYQNLSINQTKLSGQCGRLKCCLNYELDTYIDALAGFPKKANHLYTEAGKASLMKMDIFKGLMYYVYTGEAKKAGIIAVDKERVKEILELNKNDLKPAELIDKSKIVIKDSVDFDDDLTGVIELPADKRRSRNKRRKKSGNRRPPKGSASNKSKSGPRPNSKKESGKDGENGISQSRPQRKSNPNRPKRKPNKSRNKPNSGTSNGGGKNIGKVRKPNSSRNKQRPNRRPKPKGGDPNKSDGDSPKNDI